jgi:hypothetical protein
MTLYRKIEGKFVLLSAEEEATARADPNSIFGVDSGFGLVLEADDAADLRAAAAAYQPPRRLVLKSLIITRLHGAGKLVAAKAALDSDLYARERWYAPDKPAVYADDAEVLALLNAIGADPAAILAPE